MFAKSYKKITVILCLVLVNRTLFAATYKDVTQKYLKNSLAINEEHHWVGTASTLGFDTTEALVNSNLYNQDLILLKHHQAMKVPSVFEVSGTVTGLLNTNVNNFRTQATNEKIDSGEIDVASYPRDFITTFFDFAYSQKLPTRAGHIGNSRFYLDRIFVTFGNLDRSRFFMTLGRRFLPFGQYFTYTISGSLIQSMMKTEAGSLLLGYHHSGDAGIYSSIYAFKGVNKLFWDSNQNTTPGFTIGYDSTFKNFIADVGVDYIHSITSAEAFLQDISTRQNIPGIDLHMRMKIPPVNLLGEYVQVISSFNPAVLAYNDHGAQPAGASVELAYDLNYFRNPSSVVVGYGTTYQAAGLNFPQKRMITGMNISLSANFIIGIEYQHNINYPMKTLNVSQQPDASFLSSNVVTMRLIAYF